MSQSQVNLPQTVEQPQARIGLALVRLTIGAMFVWVFFENLGKGLYKPATYAGLIKYYIDKNTAPAIWKSVMGLMVSHASMAAPLQGMTEISIGVLLVLALPGTTLNIQSLMGIVMLQGMVVSNSILIVDFSNVLRSEGHSLKEAVTRACRIRLRPILMTSLATVVGLLPMAFKLETGSEAYTPLARVIIGGLLTSIVLSIFIVPVAYLLMYRRREDQQQPILAQESH
jgi:hypothetical protein